MLAYPVISVENMSYHKEHGVRSFGNLVFSLNKVSKVLSLKENLRRVKTAVLKPLNSLAASYYHRHLPRSVHLPTIFTGTSTSAKVIFLMYARILFLFTLVL